MTGLKAQRWRGVAAASAALLAVCPARAGEPTQASLQRITLPLDDGGLMITEGTRVLLPLQSSFQVGANYAASPYLWYVADPSQEDGGGREPIVRALTQVTVAATLGVTPHGSFSVAVPTSWLDIDEGLALDEGITAAQHQGAGLGDVRAQVRWMPIHLRGPELGGGVIAGLSLPTGDPDNLLGVGAPHMHLWLVADQSGSRHRVAANLGYSHLFVQGGDPVVGGASWGEELHLRLGARWDVVRGGPSLTADLAASTVFLPPWLLLRPLQSPVEVLGGVRIPVGQDLTLAMGLGAGLTVGFGAPDWRGFAALTWRAGSERVIPRQLALPTRARLRYVERPRVVVEADADLNSGRPVRLIVAEVDPSVWQRLSYDALASEEQVPGVEVLQTLSITPGEERVVVLPRQPLRPLMVAALFSEGGGRWRLLVGDAPLRREVNVRLGYDGLTMEGL